MCLVSFFWDELCSLENDSIFQTWFTMRNYLSSSDVTKEPKLVKWKNEAKVCTWNIEIY